jgi:hypothetical protein
MWLAAVAGWFAFGVLFAILEIADGDLVEGFSALFVGSAYAAAVFGVGWTVRYVITGKRALK